MATSERLIQVEIVTPVHNRRETTLRCLRSLSRLDRTGLKVHIIVVDDGSTDGTSDAIREQFPDVEIVAGDGNLWYTAGTNRAIEAALAHDPDYVLAINDDSIFHDQCLQRLVKCAEANAPAVAGPLLLAWDQPHKIFQVAPKWNLFYGGWRFFRRLTVWNVPKQAWAVQLLVGNCLLLPVGAIKKAGLMDAQRFPHYGDGEYTVRIRRAGWRLMVEPSAYLYCQPNDPLPRLRELKFRNVLDRLWFNSHSPHSLKRLWWINWYTSPSRLLGALASTIFLVRFVLKAVGLSGRWPHDWPEDDLRTAA
jgi:GT2 family glycosyltransferase